MSASETAIPYQGAPRFDEHRNTSRVWSVSPGAADDADKAIRRWAAENPAHAKWITDGYPTLTDDEHVVRFGESYATTRRKR